MLFVLIRYEYDEYNIFNTSRSRKATTRRYILRIGGSMITYSIYEKQDFVFCIYKTKLSLKQAREAVRTRYIERYAQDSRFKPTNDFSCVLDTLQGFYQLCLIKE